jgi:hypothetical protein
LPAACNIWRHWALIAAILGGSAAIAWTSLGRWEWPAIGPKQLDYYNLLVSGFRKGSLALDIEVPEALKHVENPWDPSKRPPDVGAPHDVSYYNGHFYLYFGVVPAVVLFLPFRLLTGRDLPLVLGSLAFEIGSFLVAACLWLRIVRDHFPRAGSVTRVAGIAALGLAGGQWVLARRISIWEPPIIAGNFFMVCMLASGYRALHARNPWGWLAASGLALGLATGSRPGLIAAAPGLACLALAVGFGDGSQRWRVPVRRTAMAALSAGLPLAAVVAGLLAYNQARFGNPFEFGLNYQLTSASNARHFSPSYIPFNSFTYFLAAPQWGRYFPFVHPIVRRAMPSGYYEYEFVYGALIVCPVIWWGLLAPAWLRRAEGGLRSFVWMLLAVALGTTLVLMCFDTAAARYEADFLPWWVWLAALGWCLLEDRLASRGGKGLLWASRLAFGASAAFSCVVAFCASAELHGILESQNPAAYVGLSRFFNAPTALAERLSGYRGGAVTMNLSFAKRPLESFEPLVVTGVVYQKDYVYLYYQSDNVVRFCYSHPGDPVASSADVSIQPGRSYPLRIECPSLYPPEGHPAFNGWGPAEVDAYKRWVRIDFNGQTVLIDSRRSNDASPGTLQVGEDRGGIYGRRFAGRITQVRREGWTRPGGDLGPAGDFVLSVALPPVRPANNQPLVSAGAPGSADILGLRMDDPDHYMFVYESWGAGIWQSRPFDAPSDRLVSVRVRLGASLGLDEGSPLGILGRSVVVWRDGAPVWWRHSPRDLGPNPRISLMSNAAGSSVMASDFQGRFVSARRIPLDAAWHPGPFAALELELGGRGSGNEPLLATGRKGRSDTLVVRWLAGGRARLLYDHWDAVPKRSEAFDWSELVTHRLRLEMPSVEGLGTADGTGSGEGPLRASVDGVSVWETSVSYYPAASDTLAVGRNASGCSSAGPELRCAVLDIRQDPLVPADGSGIPAAGAKGAP